MIHLAFACLIILVILKVVLKAAADIESNPDPRKLLKSVRGNFNQGNIAIFGTAFGRQCASSALFSISGFTLERY